MTQSDWDSLRLRHYDSLTKGVAWVDGGPRSEVEVSGRDRARVVHNFCTADIRRLTVGQGTEAFILNVKGMTLGHVGFFVASERIELSTVADQAAMLITHMRQYVVSEMVEFTDASAAKSTLLLAGPDAMATLTRLNIGPTPANRMDHCRGTIAMVDVAIRRTDLLGASGFEIVVPSDSKESVASFLSAAGIVHCPNDVLETVRMAVHSSREGASKFASIGWRKVRCQWV